MWALVIWLHIGSVLWASQVALGRESGKPVMQEMQVRFLGWEDLLWKEITTCSSILAWEIQRTRGGKRVDTI